jgi:hypothetical protein
MIDLAGECVSVCRTEGRILGEAARDEVIELVRDAGRAGGQPRCELAQVQRHDVGGSEGVEWRPAGDEREQHAAEGVDVRAHVDVGCTADLFRGHVRRRADHGGAQGVPAARIVRELCDPEVEDLGALAAGDLWVAHDHEIFGLEVAMNDAAFVSRAERVRDLTQDPQGVAKRERALAMQPNIERLAVE